MKVLIAEDDIHTRDGLREILEGEGYQTVTAADGEQALQLFEREAPDFVCLDIMMPNCSGYEVCRRLRATDETIPIIFISAKTEEIDKVVGLELGADDFIVKPFGIKEVVARIRAVTRRSYRRKRAEAPGAFRLGDLEVCPSELRARREGKTVELSLRELSLLALFAENPGRVLTRREIFARCWGIDHLPNSRTLDQAISKLRKRIEIDAKDPQLIQTVHGAGYRYEG